MGKSMSSVILNTSQWFKACVVTIIGLAALFVVSASVFAANYYISPTGSDSNPGTESMPFKSIMHAQSVASSGDTVYIRGGVYDDLKLLEPIAIIIMSMI